MPAPVGNEFWKARSKHGRDLIFSSPTVLWEACCEYFEYVTNNPWYKAEAIKGGDLAGTLINLPAILPFTWDGLYLFLGTNRSTFDLYEKKEDFIAVTTQVRQIIFNQKFTGAATGFFNPSIIARDLGLAENVNSLNTNVNADLTAVKPEEIKAYRDALNEDY